MQTHCPEKLSFAQMRFAAKVKFTFQRIASENVTKKSGFAEQTERERWASKLGGVV